MNGITELQIFYILISIVGMASAFGLLEGIILRLFKRFVP
jgi:hypothetical protein